VKNTYMISINILIISFSAVLPIENVGGQSLYTINPGEMVKNSQN